MLRRPVPDDQSLDAMLDQVTLGRFDRGEQAWSLWTVLCDQLRLPFGTQILGLDAVVERLELDASDAIMAICSREGGPLRVPLADLLVPAGAAGAEWVSAYRRWHAAWHA